MSGPWVDGQHERFIRLIDQGVSNAEACGSAVCERRATEP